MFRALLILIIALIMLHYTQLIPKLCQYAYSYAVPMASDQNTVPDVEPQLLDCWFIQVLRISLVSLA
jgi:hypothetical protein